MRARPTPPRPYAGLCTIVHAQNRATLTPTRAKPCQTTPTRAIRALMQNEATRQNDSPPSRFLSVPSVYSVVNLLRPRATRRNIAQQKATFPLAGAKRTHLARQNPIANSRNECHHRQPIRDPKIPHVRPGRIHMKSLPLATVLLALLTLPARAADAPNVVGSWEYRDPNNGVTITFNLNPDGTGKVVDDDIKYTVAGDRINVVINGDTIAYTFKLDGETMTVSGGDLERPTPFTRKGAAPKKGLGSKLKAAAAADPAKPAETAKSAVPADTAKPANPTSNSPIGVWRAADGDQLEIKPDAFVYGGATLPATVTPTAVKISANGQILDCPLEVTGNTMKITIGGTPLTLTRVGAAPAPATDKPATDKPAADDKKPDDKKPAADDKKAGAGADNAKAATLLPGNWMSPTGTAVVRADGTIRIDGKEGKWQADATNITLSDNANWVKIPYKLDGDTLVLGTGPTQTLTRVSGPVGVWSVTEASLDPKIFISFTQTVALYPDGSVGYSKAEGGATRTQVTEHLERFSSFRNNAGNVNNKSVGRWQTDADGNVTIQFNAANKTWQGRVDPRTGKLVVPRAGVLNEGSTLIFERQ